MVNIYNSCFFWIDSNIVRYSYILKKKRRKKKENKATPSEQFKNLIEKSQNQEHNFAFSRLGTCTSKPSRGVCVYTSFIGPPIYLSEIIRSCKYFPHVNKGEHINCMSSVINNANLESYTCIDIHLRRVWKYQKGNQNPWIEEGQTIQWPKEKGQTTIYKTLHWKLKIE